MDEGMAPGESMKGLEAAGSFIRRELGKVLRVRRIPELRFVHDTTLDSANRIEEVLKEVLPEDGAGVDDLDSDPPEAEGAGGGRGGEE
jgi:ribosome-binding factor A